MIGIIGAINEEVQDLKAKMTGVCTEEKAGMTFFNGFLKDRETVIVVSGVGKVNAAACTQILIDCFHADRVINTGIAGALKNEINIGDIVLSSDAVQHDMDVQVFGYRQGQIPRMKSSVFQADKTLIGEAEKACRKTHPELGVFIGRVVSGDQFIADNTVRENIARTFDAFCCEMEGAAVAQVCSINRIPFIIIRAMSNKADGTASGQYDVFEKKAIGNFVDMTLEMVSGLQ